MANGFCPSILAQLSDITQCNTPAFKVTPAGFLQKLLEDKPSLQLLTLSDGNGHQRDVRYKYKKRIVPSQTDTDDNCNINYIPAWLEAALATTNFRKVAFFIDDETMAKYCADASRTVMVGQPGTPLMQEFMTDVMNAVNGLVGGINQDLLTLQAIKFGRNVVTGLNTAQTVNIPKDATQYDLSTGITKILADASENEFCGDISIVGSGIMNNFQIQQLVSCCNAGGIDMSRFTGFRFYHDLYAKTAWGTNQVGVFSQGSVGLIDIIRYQGFRAGDKGVSQFFTLPLPVLCPNCNGGYDALEVDAQLKYFDCPQDIESECDGTVPINRGYALILSKTYGLFNVPSDAYQNEAIYSDCGTDRLSGNNGTLRYTITNS